MRTSLTFRIRTDLRAGVLTSPNQSASGSDVVLGCYEACEAEKVACHLDCNDSFGCDLKCDIAYLICSNGCATLSPGYNSSLAPMA